MRKKIKRLLAAALLLSFVFFTVFGAVGVAISSHHNCTGVHCQTCVRVAAIEKTLGVLKLAIIVIVGVSAAKRGMEMLAVKVPNEFAFLTSVDLKIKLND